MNIIQNLRKNLIYFEVVRFLAQNFKKIANLIQFRKFKTILKVGKQLLFKNHEIYDKNS